MIIYQTTGNLRFLRMHRFPFFTSQDSQWFSILLFSMIIPYFYSLLQRYSVTFLDQVQTRLFNKLERFDYVHVQYHQVGLYRFVQLFLDSKAEMHSSRKKVMSYTAFPEHLFFALEKGETLTDCFQGVQLEWRCMQSSDEGKQLIFQLKTRKEDRSVQRPYLIHIMRTVQAQESAKVQRYLYTYKAEESYWESSLFRHPASFDTLALEPELKSRLLRDLLHGPPGTGKSTLIAAIANHMSYNLFDLDLSGLKTNGQLRQVLAQTCDKSVVVIEDIDCCFSNSLQARTEGQSGTQGKSGITLSGLLNFADGLWSGCGDERIFIFTTNHVEKLDPALLRKGRMDLHIEMSYCRIAAFKQLMKTYLEIEDHELLPEIEKLLQEANVTPADVAEVLLEMRIDPTAALQNMISEIKAKAGEREQVQMKNDSEAEVEQKIR